MFSKVTQEPVGFESTWSSNKESEDKGEQTTKVPYQDKTSQATYTKDSEVQTQSVPQKSEAQYNEDNLVTFLQRVTPSLIGELDKIERSKAFISYHKIEELGGDTSKELYKLSCDTKDKVESEVVSVSWSCTGNVVMIGFGFTSHSDWCSHNGKINFYNINKHGFNGSTPERVISTNSCVTSIAAHPYEPSIVAVGCYFGEVLFLNLQKEGEDVYMENTVSHSDAVTQLSWSHINSQLVLISSSIDGCMFVFKVSPLISTVTLLESYYFEEDDTGQARAGVSSFSFSPTKQGIFVAAVEGGKLLHCSSIAPSTNRPRSAVVPRNPTVQTLTCLNGHVTNVKFSPHLDQIFAVATAQQNILIYSLEESTPIREIWTEYEVTRIAWNPSQANTILVLGVSSYILAYDTNTGKNLQKIELDNVETREDTPFALTVMAYNRKSPRLLVVGSNSGEAFIFEIPMYFKIK